MATLARTAQQQRAAAPSRRASVSCSAHAFSRVGQLAATAAVATGLLAAAPAALAQGVQLTVPADQVVSSPVHVEMAVDGMAVRPAADGVIPGTGHFHVYIDIAEADRPAEGEAIPFDAAHQHFGKGQTAADLELAPGKHTLTLQFADALHQSYGDGWASSTSVDVK